MHNRINKTSICCIVFLDIIDYSKKPDFEQIEVKSQFNDLINHSLKNVAQADRIILDTGDGAAIAYMGSPEDALFMAMSIRDGVIKSNTRSSTPLYVRFGINLGPVRVVSDINGHPNLIGDGINVAQRIMNFAKPNQILVSRSYYEVTSRLTQEISQMFDYSGVKQDKHVREHEIYSVRLLKDLESAGGQPLASADAAQPADRLAFLHKINWNYVALSLLMLATLFVLAKLAFTPTVPAGTDIASVRPSPFTKSAKPSNDASTQEKTSQDSATQDKLAQDDAEKARLAKSKVKKQSGQGIQNNTSTQADGDTSKKSKSQGKSRWDVFTDSVKQGHSQKCTQAEITMGQCK